MMITILDWNNTDNLITSIQFGTVTHIYNLNSLKIRKIKKGIQLSSSVIIIRV